MGLSPSYRLSVNDTDITRRLAGRLSSYNLSVESEHQSDELFLTLSDTDRANPIIKPPVGAVLSFAFGYDDDLVDQGKYVVSSLEGSGGTTQGSTFGIRARAAPYTGTPDGQVGFQTQKTRSWKAGTTIGKMVQKMAQEHGMTAAISPGLADIGLSHYDQTEESDISFLVRLARHYDAVAKPAGSRLLFVARGVSQTASGQQMAPIKLTESDVASWHWDEDRVITPGTVVALYHTSRKAETRAVSVGSGNPVRRFRRKFRNAQDARAAAMAEMARRARRSLRLTVTMKGNPRISAETTAILDKTFRHGADGLWLAHRVQHAFDSSAGSTTQISFERPNSDPTVAAHLAGQVSDAALKPA